MQPKLLPQQDLVRRIQPVGAEASHRQVHEHGLVVARHARARDGGGALRVAIADEEDDAGPLRVGQALTGPAHHGARERWHRRQARDHGHPAVDGRVVKRLVGQERHDPGGEIADVEPVAAGLGDRPRKPRIQALEGAGSAGEREASGGGRADGLDAAQVERSRLGPLAGAERLTKPGGPARIPPGDHDVRRSGIEHLAGQGSPEDAVSAGNREARGSGHGQCVARATSCFYYMGAYMGAACICAPRPLLDAAYRLITHNRERP